MQQHLTAPSLQPVFRIQEENGSLYVLEGQSLPFTVCRVFVVVADQGQIRGNHAHKRCSQFLVAVSGAIEVQTEDQHGTLKNWGLSEPTVGLWIPPMTWATQKYVQPNSMLVVACDREFEEEDYIRDYQEFRRRKRSSQADGLP